MRLKPYLQNEENFIHRKKSNLRNSDFMNFKT